MSLGARAAVGSPDGPMDHETPDHSTSRAALVPPAACLAQRPEGPYWNYLEGMQFRGEGFRLRPRFAKSWACLCGSPQPPRARTPVSLTDEIRRYQCRPRAVAVPAGPIDATPRASRPS